jgi:hypothetical protein
MSAQLTLYREGAVRKFLWVKAVRAVDLQVHCARSLVGEYLRIDRFAEEQTIQLPAAAAWYFCGVTEPYEWAKNDHALLVPAPGETHEVYTHGYVLGIEGARPQPFGLEDVPLDDPRVDARDYRTCRNWQAAHQLQRRHAFPTGVQQ